MLKIWLFISNVPFTYFKISAYSTRLKSHKNDLKNYDCVYFYSDFIGLYYVIDQYSRESLYLIFLHITLIYEEAKQELCLKLAFYFMFINKGMLV